jgi:hypothetical protein
MNVSIRSLPKKVIGPCGLCASQEELPFRDADLAARICQKCEPLLDAAEMALLASKCRHPSNFLVFRNP